MLSERDIEPAPSDAFDFVWGNLPAAKRAEFSRHLSGCRYCQGVVQEYREIGRIITLLPPHVAAASRPRRPDSRRHGRRPGRGSRPSRSPGRCQERSRHPGLPDLPAPASGRARDPGSSRSPSSGLQSRKRPRAPQRPSASRHGRVGRPADGHSPAGVAAPPRSLRRHGCRRRGHHRRRHRGPAQPWPGPRRSRPSQSLCMSLLRPRYSVPAPPAARQRPAKPAKAGRST